MGRATAEVAKDAGAEVVVVVVVLDYVEAPLEGTSITLVSDAGYFSAGISGSFPPRHHDREVPHGNAHGRLMQLLGTTVAVTGAASGLGEATARHLHSKMGQIAYGASKVGISGTGSAPARERLRQRNRHAPRWGRTVQLPMTTNGQALI
jgi:hypothetical protein